MALISSEKLLTATLVGSGTFVGGFILGFLLAHRKKRIKFLISYEANENEKEV